MNRDTLLADIELSRNGERIDSPERIFNWKRSSAISALVFQSLVLFPNFQSLDLSTKPNQHSAGKALIIGQNHYQTQDTNRALPDLKKSGAKFFAIELPCDYTEAFQTYLKSERTQEDRHLLSLNTITKTNLNPTVIEHTRNLKEKTLNEITGTTHTVTTQEIQEQALLRASQSPDHWGSGTPMLSLKMMENAHDAGLQVVCIDLPSEKLETLPKNLDSSYASRNLHMAKQLALLTQKGNAIAAVGAAHTGIGNKSSVEETARRLGVSCISIDSDVNENITSATNFLGKADRFAATPKHIIQAFHHLVPQNSMPLTEGNSR